MRSCDSIKWRWNQIQLFEHYIHYGCGFYASLGVEVLIGTVLDARLFELLLCVSSSFKIFTDLSLTFVFPYFIDDFGEKVIFYYLTTTT